MEQGTTYIELTEALGQSYQHFYHKQLYNQCHAKVRSAIILTVYATVHGQMDGPIEGGRQTDR